MRTALVTGASRGIGRGIALDLAAQGFGLTVTSRKESDLLELAEQLREAGSPQVEIRPADLADREAAAAVVEAHHSAFETMNALVLSGGVGTAGPLADLPAHRIDKTFAVNVTSAIALVQRALPLLRAAAAGDVAHGARVITLPSITPGPAGPESTVPITLPSPSTVSVSVPSPTCFAGSSFACLTLDQSFDGGM